MPTQNIYDLVDTWNASGTTFSAIKMNVTDTASASGSLLMDLQVGGTSRFKVQKNGDVTFASTGGTISFSGSAGLDIGTFSLLRVASVQLGGSNDLILGRRTAANLRLGAADAASPVAQTLSVQSVVAGTTNTAGANLTITGSQGTGTGAGGSIVFQVAPAGSSGTAQNALADALTINSARQSIFAAGTRAAPAIVFSGATTMGFWNDSNSQVRLSSAGADWIGITASTINLPTATSINWAGDVYIQRDAANKLALRNGANAQAFRVYNTFTSATDFERANIFWDSNVLKIGTEKGSAGGTARALAFQTDGVTRFTISASSATLTVGSGSGTINLGAGGIIITRYINNGNNSLSMFDFVADATGTATFALSGSAPLLRFGGTTSSFPALKRNSTALETKLADDSAYAPHAMQYLDVTDGITAPASATGRARIYVDTADGDLKVIFADGTVKTIVTDT